MVPHVRETDLGITVHVQQDILVPNVKQVVYLNKLWLLNYTTACNKAYIPYRFV